jgi:transcriptional regulator with GAF, ATPase, and Fis domain
MNRKVKKTNMKSVAVANRRSVRRQSTRKTNTPVYDKGLISTILEVFAEYQIEKILKLVVDKIPKLVQANEASLFWYDRETNRIILRQTSGAKKQNIGKHAYALGEGLTGWVAKNGRALRINNIEDEKELKRIDPTLRWSDKYKGFEYASTAEKEHRRAFLAVPIKIEGITVGVLRIAKTLEPNTQFSKEHEELLITFAEHLSTILKKAELIQRAEDFNSLIDDDDLILFKNPQTVDAYLRWAVNLIPTILISSGCTIFLKDENSDSYVLKYATKGNPLEDQIDRASYKLGEGLTGWVLLKGKALRVNDIENTDELKQIDPKLQWLGKHLEYQKHHSNFLAAPIRTPKEVYGVIRLSKESKDMPFTEEDERLLSKYGRFLGSALRSLQLEQDGTMIVKPHYEARYFVTKDCGYVLMPYSKEWTQNVKRIIKNAIESQGLCFRIADEEVGGYIMKDIWRGICEARIVVADLSTANPNVAYEVGLADVLGKQIILLAQDRHAVPFDFVGKRLLVYSLDRIDKLQDELANRISRLLQQV